jgi:16S rRNA G966 N2-methylase RsmD
MSVTLKRMKPADKKTFSSGIISESRKYKTVDYGKFTIVKETLYSSVRPYHFLQIGKILKRIFKKPKLIVDMCAHIGGSTINLANIYPTTKFISIELKKSVFNTLNNNIYAFGYQNRILPVNENCIPFIKKMITKNKPDFINLDPPWGGPGYVKKKKMMLFLNNTTGRQVPLYDIINDIFSRKLTSCVTFKAPNNFDMEMFKQNVLGIMKVFPIYNNFPICQYD